MKTAIVPFKVLHRRLVPKRYEFTHRFFWFKLDLDNPANWPTRLVSINRFNLYSFFDKDHLKLGAATARENFILFARNHGLDTEIKNVVIYTQLRFLGYVFNPISLVVLIDIHDRTHAIIEIGNTFNELKPFFIHSDNFKGNSFHYKTQKHFYISPFIEHDNDLDFIFKSDNGNIHIFIENLRGTQKVLQVSFSGSEVAATTTELIKQTLIIPFVTFKIIFLIHYHAFVLWMKGIKYFSKKDNQELQRGFFTWKA